MAAEPSAIRWQQDDDGIVTLVLDAPNQSANTMKRRVTASMRAVVDRLEARREGIAGVIVASAKSTFMAGRDLNDLEALTRERAHEFAASVRESKALLRRLEKLGRPVVAAINGSALGGGLALALACHHRIVVDDPRIRLGNPEVTLGLMPGAGGVVRTVRMLGLSDAWRRCSWRALVTDRRQPRRSGSSTSGCLRPRS